MAEMWCGNVDELQEALHSEDGQAVIADMANFVTGGATLLISDE